MAYLKLTNRNGSERLYLAESGDIAPGWKVLIGRGGGNHLKTFHRGSSGNHAVVTFDGRHFAFTDRGSTNGTWLVRRRGQPVRMDKLARDVPFVLHNGDELELGRPDQLGHVDRLRFYDGPIEIGPENSAILDNPHPELILTSLERTDSQNLREVIDAILEFSRTLATKFEDEDMAKDLIRQMPRVFPKGQRFLFFATVPNTRYLRVLAKSRYRLGRILSDDDAEDPTYSKTIYRQVVEDRSAVIYSNTGQQNLAESIQGKSIMCVPVESHDGRVLGMLQVDADQSSKFTKEDLEILKVIAYQVGATMQMAELHQLALELARHKARMKYEADIVNSILPRSLPQIAGFEFYADYMPCDEVGGDFYHFTQVDSDRLAIGVCDVVGYGLPFALILTMLFSELRIAIIQHLDPAKVLEHLDAVLTPVLNPPDTFSCRYITMSLAFLNIHDGTMSLANGGHPDLLIRRADGSIDYPDRGLSGRAVGIDYGEDSFKADNFFEKRDAKLNPGDVAIYYTDGVIDADDKNGKPFGGIEELRRFGEVVSRTQGGPKPVGEAVMKALKEHTAGATVKDDITIVCFGPTASFVPSTS